jgi:signal transduction histidine kinase
MRDWTYPALLAQLRQLPPRSIAILSSFSGDQQGHRFNSGDLITSVTRAAPVPVYGIARNWAGDGIVGGAVMDFAEDGRHAGQLLLGILRSPGGPLPRAEEADTPIVVDWRQIQRWEMSEERLPPDAEVLFRTATVWERYWFVILAVLALMTAQSLLIGLLLLERRRRIRSQRMAEESRQHVAHIARVATLGELAAAVSHELRQPLTAIRMNAESGAQLLMRARPDLREAREIFEDIVRDDQRASEVLDHIRMLLRKEVPGSQDVDLNRICAHAIQLLEHDASLRGVRLGTSLAARLPLVRGDPVQLEQVVLNLAINALDAVQTSPRDREVIVGTAAGRGSVEMFVRDTGPGLPPEAHQRVFEPFFSTKSSGLGMGLAIVRSIVERHQGQVSAENSEAGGAVFRVELPVADAALGQGSPTRE